MTFRRASVLIFGFMVSAATAFAQGAAPAQPDASASEPAQSATAALPPSPTNRPESADEQNLLEVYRLAVQNDPTIRKAESDYLATTENKPLARSKLLPSISLSASKSSDNSTNPNPPTNFITGQPQLGISKTVSTSDSNTYGLSLSQTIFDWGSYVQLKQADKIVTQAETTYDAAKQDLMVRVATAYFDVLSAQDTLAAQIAAREAASQQLEQAKQRFNVGLTAITDVQESQAAYDSAVATVISGQQALALSQEKLREIIGERITDLAGPTQELPLMPPDPSSPDAWVEVALKKNPTLIAARIGADIAQDNITIARSTRLPTLSLSSGYSNRAGTSSRTLHGTQAPPPSHSESGSFGYNWSLNLSVPLFNGGQISSQVQQRVYQHRSAIEESELVARQTERQTRDDYLSVISSISQVKALQQAVKSNETALKATQAGFQVGTRTTVDVIVAQNNLRTAQTNYAKERYAYIINLLKLQQDSGGLSIDDMQKVNGWLK